MTINEVLLNEILIDLNDVLSDIEFDYNGTDSVPYQKLKDVIGFIEEIFPFIDIIPTFTLTWLYTYVFKNKKLQ